MTARKMKYFEEGRHDRGTDRRSQLMMFVSFVNEFRTAKEHPLGKVMNTSKLNALTAGVVTLSGLIRGSFRGVDCQVVGEFLMGRQ